MDLDAFGERGFSELFLHCYHTLFPAVETDEDYRLFVYYKMYRANIRAKVNSLRARSADNATGRTLPLLETEKYLRLMAGYMKNLAIK